MTGGPWSPTMNASAAGANPAWSWTTTWKHSWQAGRLPRSDGSRTGQRRREVHPVHEAWWTAARAAHGEAAGTRALIEVLLPARHVEHEHVVAGLAAAHRAGALTADAVALEARKAAEGETFTEPAKPAPARPAQS